jgi:DNA polymerase III alpha subunit
VYECDGEEHAAMVCNVVTYRAHSAVRDVAKTLSFPPDVIDRAAKVLDTHSATKAADLLPAATKDEPLALPPEGVAPSLPWPMLS